MQRQLDTKSLSAGASPAPSANLVAFDCETHLVQPGLLTPPLVCASLTSQVNLDGYIVNRDRAYVELKRTLVLRRTIVGANIAYDFGVILAEQPGFLSWIFAAYEAGRVFDVQIAEALNAIANGHFLADKRTGVPFRKGRYSLERCVEQVLGRTDAKLNDYWRKRYALLENKPISEWPADAVQYPKDDARNTYEVAVAQRETHRNLHAMKREARAAWALHLGAVWGLRVDPGRLARLETETEEKHQAWTKKFTGLGFIRENGKKDLKAIRAAVEKAYGNPPKTEKGGIRTDRDTLLESGNEDLEDFADNEFEKIRTTYIPFLKQGTEVPLNLRPNVLVSSFRTSYDGVIQQMPRSGDVRSCFRARPGYVYCSADYATLELCTLAQVCLWIVKHSAMAKAINAGVDLHAMFAASLMGVKYSLFMEYLKGGVEEAKNYRQAAKAANFGFPGGMGAAKFVAAKRREGIRFCVLLKGASHCGAEKITEWKLRPCPPVCKLCVIAAEELRNQWFEQWPEIRPYFEHVARLADTTGEILIPDGDKGSVRGGVGFTDGANGYFQGLAAIGAKHALWLVTKEAYTDESSPLYGSRFPFFVHDEIMAEMPEATAHLAGPRMAELMVAGMREFVPDVKISVEPALMRYWDKGAKPVYRDGKLSVWGDA